MKVTPLERTGDSFKVLYQDEETLKGFIIGLSGTIARVWGLKTDKEQQDVLDTVAKKILDIRGFDALHDVEKVYTTNDTCLPLDLAIDEMARSFCNEVK